MAVISADAPSRWLLSSVAALAAHGAVLLAAPDAPVVPHATPAPLWMSLEVSEQTPVNAEASGAGAGARAQAPVASPRRRASVAAKKTSAVSHVASVEPSEVAREGASEIAERNFASVSGAGGLGDLDGSGQGNGAGAGTGTGTGVVVLRPALIATRNPCLGYFPAGADVDHGRVQIEVHVDETGHASARAIMLEAPLGQEFGRAARACAAALRFAPARDSLGLAVAADAKLELHFHRS